MSGGEAGNGSPSEVAATGGAVDPEGESPRERLARECGVLGWHEIARHFARGVLIMARPGVPFLDVAECLVGNDTARLQAWLDSGEVTRASDEDARDWNERAPEFRCIVVAPWVLVQERSRAERGSPEA